MAHKQNTKTVNTKKKLKTSNPMKILVKTYGQCFAEEEIHTSMMMFSASEMVDV